MKRAEHNKKEMIKSDLIKHEQLIADPVIREKVDKLREERDEKRRLEEEQKNLELEVNKNKKQSVFDKDKFKKSEFN